MNLVQGSMNCGDDEILWEATVWRPKMHAIICAEDVDNIRKVMDADLLDFDLAEMGNI